MKFDSLVWVDMGQAELPCSGFALSFELRHVASYDL